MQSFHHPYVLTVISAEDQIFSDELQQAVTALLAPKEWRWLERGRAADLYFTLPPKDEQLAALHDIAAFDAFFQPVNQREKFLLICDMDSTIIAQECIDEIADLVGKKPQVSEITERAMRGELDFNASLRERVALLEGLPQSELQRCYDERIRLRPGAANLVRVMREHGARCLLVSGGFVFFTAQVGRAAGFHEHYANKLEMMDGTLTGKVQEPILDKNAKKLILDHKMKKFALPKEHVLAVGDGANDLPMLQTAGMGVAFKAKPVVQEAAGFRLNHNPLDALLWVVGLPRPAG
jgi:phosphoserine phosphatase